MILEHTVANLSRTIMLKSFINEFRNSCGKPSVSFDDYQENQYCLWHCLYMANIQNCCHTPDFFLCGKSEAVAVMPFFYHNYEDVLHKVVFEGFANSPEHKKVLLSDNLACGFYDYSYNVFVTIRGW